MTALTQRTAAVTTAVRSHAQLALVAAGAVITWLTVRFALGFPPGAFPWAGANFVGPGAPSELIVDKNGGYDGQFVYRLAIDPFTTAVTGHGITFDRPGYRQQRIMTALLAHAVASLPGISTAVAIIVVNALAIVVAVVAGRALASSVGRGTYAGLLLALPACLPVSVAADLTEPVAWAAVLCGLLAARRQRWMLTGVAFTIAVLARETTGLFVVGYIVESLVVLRHTPRTIDVGRLWLLLPVAVWTAWEVRLWAVWGQLPVMTGFTNTAGTAQIDAANRRLAGSSQFPLVGIARTFLNGIVTGDNRDPIIGLSYVFERCVLVALIATAGWLLATRRVRVGTAVTIAWILGMLVALSMAGWVDDVQFLRPTMEAWGLSIFVLLQVKAAWPRRLLLSAAAVTAWGALFALIRS